MIRFVLAILLFIVAAILAGIAVWGRNDDEVKGWHLGAWGFGTFCAALFFLLLSCFRMVAPGTVGVPVTLGHLGSDEAPGLHFVTPITHVNKLSTRTQVYVLVANPNEGQSGDDSVQVRGSDQSTGNVNARLNWHLTQSGADRMYTTYGTDLITRIIRPTVRTCLNDAAAEQTLAADASTGRSTFEHDTNACIDAKFQTDTSGAIVNDGLQIAETTLPDSVQQSVNDKAASFSELQATTNKAQGARIDALGKADSQAILKCGGVSVTLPNGTASIKPNADVAGNCRGVSHLSNDYLAYLYIQALTAAANSPNHSTFVLPPGANLNSLLNLGG